MRVALSQLPLLEFLAAVLVFVLVLCMSLDRSVRVRDQSRADTLIANLETIQTAIERYYTDYEQYPLYLLGGDIDGWADWHAQFDERFAGPRIPQNRWVADPLIKYGYLESYPENPFVSEPLSTPCDPRFGMQGSLMGNGVDDPMLFRDIWEIRGLNLETCRTQVGLGRPLDNVQPWMMGGRRTVVMIGDEPRFLTVHTHWPGAFVYRGFQTPVYHRKGWNIYTPGMFYPALAIDRFLVGVFGGVRDPRMDMIRLESHDPTGQQLDYRHAPPWSAKSRYPYPLGIRESTSINDPGGLPELAGGGTQWEGPFIPYHRALDSPNIFLYGSPDGEPDGLIRVVHSEREKQY